MLTSCSQIASAASHDAQKVLGPRYCCWIFCRFHQTERLAGERLGPLRVAITLRNPATIDQDLRSGPEIASRAQRDQRGDQIAICPSAIPGARKDHREAVIEPRLVLRAGEAPGGFQVGEGAVVVTKQREHFAECFVKLGDRRVSKS